MKLIEFLNNNIIWGLPMVALMIATGIYLNIKTKGVIFSKFSTLLKCTFKNLFKKGTREGAITPFQALCTALAGTVGTGNIVGVALAIATGGPGAMFWLWASALLGMVVKFSEVTLSVAFRTKNKRGELVGGPMYYIEKGLGKKWLALLFATFGFLASFGIGASVQSNSLANSLNSAFNISPLSIGIFLALLSALVLMGGIKRISSVTEILVPFMAIFYIVGSLTVLLINANEILPTFTSIFASAFKGTSAVGGFAGATVIYACRVGMARGVFTHEAGMGSAPIAHASADTDHPVKQGFFGAVEVFFDSIVMCTVTGLVILTSGVWKLSETNEGVMSSLAFEKAFKGGGYIVTIGIVLFTFATIIAWYYYGEKCVEYIFNNSVAVFIYKALYILMVFLGCVLSLDTVWEFADLFNGLMAIPNLIALITLSPIVAKLTKDFFK